jgi:diacylglycerol kinase (ATP)
MTLNQRDISSPTTNNGSSHSTRISHAPSVQNGSRPQFGRSSPDSANMKRQSSWKVAHNLFISFKYAWEGVSYAFRTQRNFRIHVVIGSTAIGLGFFLQLSLVEISIISLTIGAVLAMELLNTALESLVDLTVEQSYHPLAKIAKDCAAAAVLISALAAIFIAGCLLLPPLYSLIQSSLN